MDEWTYVDAGQCDEDRLASMILDGDCDANDPDEILADHHADCTNEEQPPPTDTVDSPESRDCHA